MVLQQWWVFYMGVPPETAFRLVVTPQQLVVTSLQVSKLV